ARDSTGSGATATVAGPRTLAGAGRGGTWPAIRCLVAVAASTLAARRQLGQPPVSSRQVAQTGLPQPAQGATDGTFE
ncbi:MAG: hypothetical protein WBE79_09370, partial [Candidatus Cybelea sp.]